MSELPNNARVDVEGHEVVIRFDNGSVVRCPYWGFEVDSVAVGEGRFAVNPFIADVSLSSEPINLLADYPTSKDVWLQQYGRMQRAVIGASSTMRLVAKLLTEVEMVVPDEIASVGKRQFVGYGANAWSWPNRRRFKRSQRKAKQ